MNRGPLQSSPVQQMMTGNPNWWSVNNMRPPTHQQPSPFLLPPSTHFPQLMPSSSSSSSSSSSPSSSSSSLPIPYWHENQDKLQESWSQLLLGGLVMGDEEKVHLNNFRPRSNLENWEEQVLHQPSSASLVDVKQENSGSSYVYGHANEDFQAAKPPPWSHSHGLMPASSPKSCVTISNNMLDFSASKGEGRHPPPDRSPEVSESDERNIYGNSFAYYKVVDLDIPKVF
uniref:Uncharacterized protein MANES_16G113000 n=1 Tax=Rhizophora mucronata TaxID=61149 RepID=A0A2P2IQA2_RHIMU